MSFPKLFIPGPTHVSDDVLEAFSTYQVGHRTPEFSDLCETVIKGIQKVLYTENRVFLASHAATGLWELGLRNAVTPNSKVLHAVNGVIVEWPSLFLSIYTYFIYLYSLMYVFFYI